MSAADAPAGPHGERPQTLLVLGARGDLTKRLLLPGLGSLVAASGLTGPHLVGSDRGEGSDEEWRALVARAFSEGDASGAAVDAVVRDTRYVAADAAGADDLRGLLASCGGRLTLYFALPPAVTVEACRTLARIGVPEGTRLVLEKPFGTDAASATALNELLHSFVPEDHVTGRGVGRDAGRAHRTSPSTSDTASSAPRPRCAPPWTRHCANTA
ncbi:hypothetical protein [Streptomyces sp. DH-12]|uniref:hypothetical protein n=1 Tax=Streptomyces sp. DH-12 TaxID=2072509 RepID=UPI0010570485|nr:hypothetical protein [Streptomyces sp. DH-12]